MVSQTPTPKPRLKTLECENLTVFSSVKLSVSPHLNVFVGENGAGKTHLLKIIYSFMAVSADEGRKASVATPTKTLLHTRIADKLTGVFRPESLGRLARRRQGRERCDISLAFTRSKFDVEFGFATNSKSEVKITKAPMAWLEAPAAYFPTRELLTIYPNFVAFYETHEVQFEETWRDTCILLGRPLRRGRQEGRIKDLLEPLERAMDGEIELDKGGRFYLKAPGGRMEMPLVAEGLRKLGMIAHLIANGTLLDNGFLFWDEPEASLNPALIHRIARTIVDLCGNGIQIFIATHSLFLLRELEILLENEKNLKPRFFGLHKCDDGVEVMQGDSPDDIGSIPALEEELKQSARFLEISGEK